MRSARMVRNASGSFRTSRNIYLSSEQRIRSRDRPFSFDLISIFRILFSCALIGGRIHSIHCTEDISCIPYRSIESHEQVWCLQTLKSSF
ncbi:hypothetical protein BDQ12DRAFT_441793 [Crucibulum laeve]|uniref:Uncharacterized protein n=1 Tax=Crucibulum laeve TaxID=68775 RepID=A0A5C3LKT5_9AGAR|nr:hypothetical protein BDQ12DRAFT_441793 [Crucibulum laeve]